MAHVTYEALCNGFEILNQNRWYWEIDNDYSSKFRIVSETVDNWECTSNESLSYVIDILDFLLCASARIFKTGIPVYSANGKPIKDSGSVIDFSK